MDSPMKEFLKKVVSDYLESGKADKYRNFSGINADSFDHDDKYVRQLLREAVNKKLVDVVTTNIFENPHVRPSANIPIDKQLAAINETGLTEIFVYPRPTITRELVELESYPPYTFQLALGKGIHDTYYFEGAVLDVYRSDTEKYDTSRKDYVLTIDDYYGSLNEEEQEACWGTVRNIGYRQKATGETLVAMCLSYLAELRPEEQHHWVGYELIEMLQDFIPNSKAADPQFYAWYHGTIRGEII